MLNWIFTNTPLHYFVQSFWRDEAFSYLLAKKSLLDIFILSARDFSPPLYYLFLHFWLKIFGMSEVALRSFSFLTFAAVGYLFYLFLTEIFKIKTKWAYVYLLLFLLNPFLNYYAFEARMYILFALFATLSFYYLYQFRPIKYFAVAILGLLTHYFMLFVLLAQVVYVLTARSYKDRDKIFQLKTIFQPVLIFIPWLIFVFTEHRFDGQFWIEKPLLKTLLQIPAIMYVGYETNLVFYQKLLFPLSFFLLIIIVYGVWKITRKKYTVSTKEKRDLLYLLLSWSFVPAVVIYLISFVYPIFLPRYLIFSGVGILLLLVFLLEQIDKRMRWVFFVALLVLTLHYNVIQVYTRTKGPVNSAVMEIKSQMKPGDLLYVTSELNFHPTEYYLDEKRVFIYGKTYEEIPQFVGKILIPKDKIVTTLPFYPNKAFILKDDLTYDIQSNF